MECIETGEGAEDKILKEFRSGYIFFQAEDGIRDDLVTGVQTCALPICERTGRPTDATCGPAQQTRERTDESGREQCDAEEDEQGADAHPDEDLGCVEPVSEEPVQERREPGGHHESGAEPSEACEPPRRQSRTLAHRGDRRDASRSPRRSETGDEGDENACGE